MPHLIDWYIDRYLVYIHVIVEIDEYMTRVYNIYYCYHQNVKWFLVPVENGHFYNIAIAILNFSLLLPI